jgi:hypothetical protein
MRSLLQIYNFANLRTKTGFFSLKPNIALLGRRTDLLPYIVRELQDKGRDGANASSLHVHSVIVVLIPVTGCSPAFSRSKFNSCQLLRSLLSIIIAGKHPELSNDPAASAYTSNVRSSFLVRLHDFSPADRMVIASFIKNHEKSIKRINGTILGLSGTPERLSTHCRESF